MTKKFIATIALAVSAMLPIATAHAAEGTPVEYKWPGFVKMTATQQDWYLRSFEARRDMGNNECLMKNLDVRGIITDLRGKCYYTQAEVDAMNAGTLIRFSATTVGTHGLMYEHTAVDVACRTTTNFDKSKWRGKALTCRIKMETYASGAQTLEGNLYGFYLVDIAGNGRYRVMNAYDPGGKWLDMLKVKANGVLPKGLE